ncbi:MAG: phospholipase [Candidatus Solibacter usitatus]|nr:phospholipase [Candidatus Solibacter usitatus]
MNLLVRRQALSFATVALLLMAGRASFGQTLKSGPQVLTFFSGVDDTEQPYGLYLPKNFNPARKYPLVVMLHGAGSNHRLALRRVFGKSNLPGENDVEATRYFPEWRDVDYIVASPLARGTMGYQGVPEKDVYDVLADVKSRFPIDEDRVYLTGLSMGGGGTLWIGLSRPDTWAAIAPVCPAPPPGTSGLASNALNFPVHFFQGGADPLVRPEGTREWVKRLQDLGTKVEYIEYPGVGHNSWENAYKDEAIFDWFAKFHRNRYPERVRFSTSRYKYDQAYWVHIDELTPGTPASIDVRLTSPNRLEIATSALGAFTLRLAGHPRFTAGRPVELSLDGQTLSARPADSLSLVRRDGAWVAAKYQAPAHSKRPGAEGPIADAIAARHIYVYGAGGDAPPEEVQARRAQAARAADWSSRFGRAMVYPRVVADKDVRPSDLDSSNLILFGTRETNTLIAKLADRLPIQLNASAAGYGLLYVYPAGGRYVLVSSGLPWWPAEPAPLPGPAGPAPGRRPFTFAPGPAGPLMGLEDYVLFKGSLENVVAGGRFDGAWRLPEADAAKMKATGVVTLATMGHDPGVSH